MIAVGVVPARGGSRGIPRKNITSLAGRPLLAYTADAVRASKRLLRCILSTDDVEIAKVGRECGLDVPFMRPAVLATDTAPSIDVMIDVAQRLCDAGSRPDVLVLLQPTTPLRAGEDIDGALDLLERTGADSVVTVAPVPSDHATEWQLTFGEDGALTLADGRPVRHIVSRRQLLRKTHYRNGAVYAVRLDTLLGQRSLYGERCLGYVMPAHRSVNIDSPDDLELAERVLAGVASVGIGVRTDLRRHA